MQPQRFIFYLIYLCCAIIGKYFTNYFVIYYNYFIYFFPIHFQIIFVCSLVTGNVRSNSYCVIIFSCAVQLSTSAYYNTSCPTKNPVFDTKNIPISNVCEFYFQLVLLFDARVDLREGVIHQEG